MKDPKSIMNTACHPLDAMAVAPNHHAVLFENEKVRVLDTLLQPGDQTPIHSHEWPASLYILSWSDFIRYGEDGRILADSRKTGAAPPAGSAMWIEPLPPHSVRNVGDAALRIIAVEIKREA
jgi:quercetin dioxygenase-like cupin family protein